MAPDLSLSIILPVYNAQSTLATLVARVLETTAEVTAQFEVVIVDDGSIDHTGDIAYELAVEYLQVRVVRHSRRMGGAAAARTGVASARGQIAFVYEGRMPLKASDLPRLWERQAIGVTAAAQVGEVIHAQLADARPIAAAALRSDESSPLAVRGRVRVVADTGRVGPPAGKITPRRRAPQPRV